MENASHWDYAEFFSGRDAAYLIAGFDSSTYSHEIEYKVQPVIAKMKKSYYSACQNVRNWIESDGVVFLDESGNFSHSDMFVRPIPRANDLQSVEIEKMFSDYCCSEYFRGGPKKDDSSDEWLPDSSDISDEDIARLKVTGLEDSMRNKIEWHAITPFFDWMQEYVQEFCDQKFSRSELRRWIAESKLRSKYKFHDTHQQHDDSDRPISANERNTLLLMIAALCKKAGIEHNGSKAASEIVRLVDLLEIGASVHKDTVRSHLDKIPVALAARGK